MEYVILGIFGVLACMAVRGIFTAQNRQVHVLKQESVNAEHTTESEEVSMIDLSGSGFFAYDCPYDGQRVLDCDTCSVKETCIQYQILTTVIQTKQPAYASVPYLSILEEDEEDV